MERLETLRREKEKSQADIVVRCYTELESMVVAQVACTKRQLLAKEISTLGADSLEKIRQCPVWEGAHRSSVCRL